MDWVKEFGGAVTVCDANGVILSMNEKACRTFAKDGGASLVGKSLYDCHPEKARAKIREIMEKRVTNAYTIEKAGVKKLIYQAPWYKDGAFAGLVELSIEIPFEMPHFVRTPPAPIGSSPEKRL
ncbi:PAS domain-containing protein [Candidatus Ozemobacteraceae bacterium]|nr:PAS domain-containing protein [Candidatus Ozemobacteraceae bacterium]